ncbi:MAG: GNAT family protein [Planctomycetota bacterium]
MSVFPPKTITLRDGATVHLRSPEVSDAAGMLEYIDEVRRDCDGIMLSPEDELPTLEWERDWVRRRREGDGVQIFAEDEAGRQIALCGIEPGKMARLRHAGSVGISIRKPWRGRGLGTALMQELIAWAEANERLAVLSLGVFEDNPRARHVYERCGFEANGRSRWHAFREGRYVDEIIMTRWVGTGAPPV